MSLFAPAETTTAYLKMALMGFQGSGKSYTAALTAIGIAKLIQAPRPVFFLDTEKGSDWVKPMFERAGIALHTAKTRAFTDLLAAIPEAEAHGSVLIVDSLTHFWVELCETYSARKAAEYHLATYRLQFQDWSFLKTEWRKFTDRFVNSSIHTILCGRAGYEYDYEIDEDTNKKRLEKTGIKMKAEGEMGYEPDLLVLMERRMNMETKADEHIAHVIKDRSTLLDGKEFAEPTFDTFLPHIQCLNLGGKQLGVDVSRNSGAAIPIDKRDQRRTQRKIVLAEIEDLLVTHYPASTGKDKVAKIAALKKHFNASWAEIEEVKPLEDLRASYDTLHQELEGKPSRYGHRPEPKPDIDDAIPGPHPLDIPPYLDRRATSTGDDRFSMWGINTE